MYLVMLRWYFSWIPKKLNTLDHQCEFETVVYNEIHRLIRYNTLLWFRHLQHFSNMAGTPKLTNWENHSHRRGIHRRQLSHSSACCWRLTALAHTPHDSLTEDIFVRRKWLVQCYKITKRTFYACQAFVGPRGERELCCRFLYDAGPIADPWMMLAEMVFNVEVWSSYFVWCECPMKKSTSQL